MKTFRLPILLIVLLNFWLQAYSQKERSIWCFGTHAKLDFSSGSPVSSGHCALSTIEGCAGISDSTGQLLFYTDGTTVYNRNDTVMAGDTVGLGGSFSSSQSAFILPVPGSTHEYYLFGTDAQAGGIEEAGSGEDSGTQYSIIDMNLDGGLGGVAQQPRHLLTPACEKIAATYNADSTGYWLVIHLWNSDAFYAYLINSNGIGAPVISHSGVTPSSPDAANAAAIGYMRISPDGNKIAAAWHDSLDAIQVFNFDRTTGSISAPTFTQSGFGGLGPYGLCFSPNSQFLYFTVNQVMAVFQYNLQSADDTAVRVTQLNGQPWALQSGPDNKIYVSVDEQTAVDQINYPDSAGTACGYEGGAINLGITNCRLGLPEFPPLGSITKVTGINNLAEAERVSVYPNPSTGSCRVSVGSNLVGSNLDIYDNEGRLILHSKLEMPDSKLDLDMAKGFYLLRVSSASINIVRKIVRL